MPELGHATFTYSVALLGIPGESLFEKYTNAEDNRYLMIHLKRFVVNTGRRTVNTEQNGCRNRSGLGRRLGTIVPSGNAINRKTMLKS